MTRPTGVGRGRQKGVKLGRKQHNPCLYCGQAGAPCIRGLPACADLGGCSDRMQAQGLGRRDWGPWEREALRHSLRALATRAAGE